MNFGLTTRVFFILLLVSLSGCFDEFRDLDKIKKFEWQPTLAVPLVNSTFSFTDFTNEVSDSTIIYADEEGLITFVYEDRVISKTGESLYSIENQQFQHSKDLPNPIIAQYPFNSSIEFSEEVEFDFATQNGQEIDSIFLKGGALELNVNWNFNQSGEFAIIFKSLFQGSQELILTHQFSSFLNYSQTIPLDGLKAILSGPGKQANTFIVEIRFRINNDGNPLPPNPSYDINLDLYGPQFQAIFGELGSITFSTSKGISTLQFFEDLQFGTIELEDPRATLYIQNSFGLGAETYLDKLFITHDKGTSQLQGPITTEPISIPAVPFNNLGSYESTSVTINNQNSNLSDLIKNIPKEISLEFTGTIENPMSKDFVLDTSAINLDLEVELPFHGKVNSLRLAHEFNFDGSIFDDLDNALLKFYTNNELPLGLLIQATFLSATGVPLIEIYGSNNNLVVASQNDADGDVIDPGENTLLLEMDRSDLQTASRSEFLKIEIEVSSFNNGSIPVKILESHQITFAVGLQSKFVTND